MGEEKEEEDDEEEEGPPGGGRRQRRRRRRRRKRRKRRKRRIPKPCPHTLDGAHEPQARPRKEGPDLAHAGKDILL